LVTARYRNCAVDPGTRPETVVLACSVAGTVIQVLPPSTGGAPELMAEGLIAHWARVR
jgi:hypothetical protein